MTDTSCGQVFGKVCANGSLFLAGSQTPPNQRSAIRKVRWTSHKNYILKHPPLLADIVKFLESEPEVAPLIRRIRGGYLKIQGTWMPFEVRAAGYISSTSLLTSPIDC